MDDGVAGVVAQVEAQHRLYRSDGAGKLLAHLIGFQHRLIAAHQAHLAVPVPSSACAAAGVGERTPRDNTLKNVTHVAIADTTDGIDSLGLAFATSFGQPFANPFARLLPKHTPIAEKA